MKDANRNPGRHFACIATILVVLGMPVAALADKASDVAKLEADCEQEREANIKPLREAEIAKCKASERNDPAYCERYWKDYGNATRRPDGTMTPRMFDDLPVCVAAYEARKSLNSD